MTMRRYHGALVVALVAFAAYLPSLRNGFAYDDVPIIVNDSRVHSLDGIRAAFTDGYWRDQDRGLYRPLTTASFAVDWVVSNGNPKWFLLINMLWNVAACVLAFLVLARFTSIAAALAGALLFAVHPVHVEAVANVVGRAEVMAAVFVLAAILVWTHAGERSSGWRTAAVAVLFILAVLTKESAVMLPGLLVLADIWRRELRPGTVSDWCRKRAVAGAVLAGVLLACVAMRRVVTGGIVPTLVDPVFDVTSGIDRLATAFQAWPTYMRLLFLPLTLLADYGPRVFMPTSPFALAPIAGVIIAVGMVAGGVYAWKRNQPAWAAILLWFPIAILPVSNLIIPIGIIVAERTLYVPSLALAAAAALAIESSRRRRSLVPVIAAAAVLMAAFSIRTVTRIPDWKSTEAIMAALLRDHPDSFRAHWHHARVAAFSNDVNSALEHYDAAIDLWPHRRALVLEAAGVAARGARLDRARWYSGVANRQWPADIESARLHAAITLDMADTVAARAVISQALQHTPSDVVLLQMQAAIEGTRTP